MSSRPWPAGAGAPDILLAGPRRRVCPTSVSPPHTTRQSMTREEFLRLAADGFNRIPLAFETLADFDTPLSIYLRLADTPNSYLLESVQGGEKWGRYSIIGLPARTVLRVRGQQ